MHLGPHGVLYVHSADEAYGADRVLLGTIRSNLRNGRPSFVLLPDDSPPGWLSEQLEALGVPYSRGPLAVARRAYLTPSGVVSYASRLLTARRHIRQVSLSLRPGIIHLNTSAILVGALIGRPAHTRVIWHVHEITQRPRSLAWIFRAAPLTADRVIVVSDAVRENLLPGRSRKVLRIYNGITHTDSPSRKVPRPGPIKVAYIGRFSEWKGYLVFVEVAERIARTREAVVFSMAGGPPPGEQWRTEDLHERLHRSEFEHRVEVFGFLPDPLPFFESADIVVVPSTSPDPLPTVVLEAMGAGCAVVGFDHGGPREMIEHGKSGLLVPPGDIDALEAAVRRLIDDNELRLFLASNAQTRVREAFSEERYEAAIQQCYSSLLTHDPHARE